MSESDPNDLDVTPHDFSSLEFDVMEMARLRLVEALMSTGRPILEAERIALYVTQGLRNAPHFLRVVTRLEAPPPAEILEALGPVLGEAYALEKAKFMLLHPEDEQHEILQIINAGSGVIIDAASKTAESLVRIGHAAAKANVTVVLRNGGHLTAENLRKIAAAGGKHVLIEV